VIEQFLPKCDEQVSFISAVFECAGEKDFVMHVFQSVVHDRAANLVQFYRQSW